MLQFHKMNFPLPFDKNNAARIILCVGNYETYRSVIAGHISATSNTEISTISPNLSPFITRLN